MKNIFAIAALLLCLSAKSQNTDYLIFDKLEHDFGNIHEEDNTAKIRFWFTNKSEIPIWIVKVETSCGCTTPEWTKDTIQPGGRGYVDAIYDTKNRVGPFSKNVMVYPNVPNYYRFLKITGTVIGKPEPEYQQSEYAMGYGNMAFSKTTITFNPLFNNQKASATIKVINVNEFPLKIKDIADKPDYAEVVFSKKELGPHDSLTITISVDGSKIKDYGEVFSSFMINTNDMLYPEKFIFLIINVKEFFPKMSAKQLKETPTATISDNSSLNLGKLTEGAIVRKTITVTNTGKSDLIIHKLFPNCSCIEASINTMVIKPGEQANINIKYDTIMQSPGMHRKWIKLITNDPKQTESSISINLEL
ncbi:MAG: DUF1573 domain-containing protein [Bacteroidia bacterium]|nr:DUF1573 domain-containing protein [Bacteroidia bacterium]